MRSIEEKYNLINGLIPDSKMQDLVFNFDNNYDDFLSDDSSMIQYFYNSIMLAAIITYRAFLDWKKSLNKLTTEEKEKYISRLSNSTIRLYNLLEGCYDVKKFDLDFVENLLVNLQIDSALDTKDNFIRMIGLNRFFSFEDNLTKYIFVLKKSRLSSRGPNSFSFDNLYEALEMFKCFSKARVEIVEYKDFALSTLKSIKLSFLGKDISLDLKELICINQNDCYFLEDFSIDDARIFTESNPQKDQMITLNYISFLDASQICVRLSNTNCEMSMLTDDKSNDNVVFDVISTTAIEDFLLNYNIINVDIIENGSYFFKDYISFNNKYIKYLALTISDVVSFQTKQAILEIYREKYEDVFNKLQIRSFYDSYNAHYYRWDEIIIFLLLEEGIFDFLVFLLQYEKYEAFLSAFYLRFGEKITKIKEDNVLIDKPTLNIQYKNSLKEIQNHAGALISLATKLLAVESADYNDSGRVLSLPDIILEVEHKYSSEKLKNQEKIVSISNLLMRVVSFLDTFYKGFLEYIRLRNVKDLSLNETWFPTLSEYKEDKELLLKSFSSNVNEAKRKNTELIRTDIFCADNKFYLGELKLIIENLFKSLRQTNSISQNRNSPFNEALYNSLGKRALFSDKQMKYHQDKIISVITKYLNCDLNNKEFVDEYYKVVRSFFMYLGGNSNSTEQSLEYSIYPLVCTYSNGVISQDGYRYSYMIVNRTNKNKPTKLKIIVDEEFDFGETYYCFPNLRRIANFRNTNYKIQERVWINPIIIPQKYYSSNISAKFERLYDTNDFENAAELIYKTDEIIYGSLFGNLNNAKIVLSYLFENKNSIFYKDYYYVIKMEGQVVAIASLYNKLPQWNSDIIEKAFRDCNITIPETMRTSYLYFEDTFNDSIGSSNVICDVCVKEEYRNKGLARCLLSNIIKKVEGNGENLLISVYSNNIVALNLYASMGFIPYVSNYDTRGQGNNKHQYEYYKMIKYT